MWGLPLLLFATLCAKFVQSVPLAPTDATLAQAQDAFAQTSCASSRNAAPRDFSVNCPAGSTGCWPSLYLLGVQKSGTTSVAAVLAHCGSVSFGIPDATDPIENCEPGTGCKEVLHKPAIDTATAAGRSKLVHLFDTTRCHTLKGDDAVAREACTSGRFLEASPLSSTPGGDTPDLASFLRVVPPLIATAAKFAVILREPVSRMLSWYNHVLDSPANLKVAAEQGNPIGSFDAYARAMTPGGGAFQIGAYDTWLRQFESTPHLRRSQLLVLEFDDLFLRSPAKNMQALSRHYGLPRVLTSMQRLPELNTKNSAQKVVVMKCSTRDFLAAAYRPHNQALAQTLGRHASSAWIREGAGRADANTYRMVDGTFPSWRDISHSIACGPREKSMGGLSQAELTAHYAARYARLPSDADIAQLTGGDGE